MDVPGGTSRVNGETVTKDILKDLIAYKTSTMLNDSTDSVKKRIRKLSDKIKIDMGVKNKPNGKLCKDLSVGSHEMIADKVIYVLKSTEKGFFAMFLFQKMYDREKTKTTLKNVALMVVLTAGVSWFVKKR